MFQRIGAAAYRADLGNITALCQLLGNPQQGQRFIHIAGTNGKGSVTHIIASVLQAAGFKVGVFASPHYLHYRERIKINGAFIPKRAVSSFVTQWQQQFQKVNASFFEITTAMAFWYFKKEKCDYVVLETGMGGRLDSTNIVTPVLSVITNISFDHQQFLGDTLPLIAGEKAGIIKPGIPVVIGEMQDETAPVFLKKFLAVNQTSDDREASVPLIFADKKYRLLHFETTLSGSSFQFEKSLFKTDLSGKFQQKNLTTALAALRVLMPELPALTLQRGLRHIARDTYFIGRHMLLQKHPLVLADSAHNEGGIKVLMEQIKTIKYRQLHVVYGTVSDKDLSKIFPLMPRAHYYFCRPDIPRGKDAALLASEAHAAGLNGQAYPSVRKALKGALAAAATGDLVLVTGSIFVVAEVLAQERAV